MNVFFALLLLISLLLAGLIFITSRRGSTMLGRNEASWIWRHIAQPILDYYLVLNNRKIFIQVLRIIGCICGVNIFSHLLLSVKAQKWGIFLYFQLDFPNIDKWTFFVIMVVVLIYYIFMHFEYNRNLKYKQESSTAVGKQIIDTIRQESDALKQEINGQKISSEQDKQIIGILPKLREAIAALHLKETANLLEVIRHNLMGRPLKTIDPMTLATVNYYMGRCYQYIDAERCAEFFDLAYRILKEQDLFDEDIYIGNIFSCILTHKIDIAIVVSQQLSKHYSDSYWQYIPIILKSKDRMSAFKTVPDPIRHDIQFIADLSQFLGNFNQEHLLDGLEYIPTIPPALTFDNVTLWLFNLNLSQQRFIVNCHSDFVAPMPEDTPYLKELFQIIDKFLSLTDHSELRNIIHELMPLHAYLGYHLTKDEKLIEEFRNCPQEDKDERYYIFYVHLLCALQKKDDAVRYIDDLSHVPQGCFIQMCVMAITWKDKSLAIRGLTGLKSPILDVNAHVIIENLRFFGSSVIEGVNISFQTDLINHFYHEAIAFYSDKQPDIDWVLNAAPKLGNALKSYAAMMIAKYDHREEALAILKPLLQLNRLDLNMAAYIEIMKGDSTYAINLYHFLKDTYKQGLRHTFTLTLLFEDATIVADLPLSLMVIKDLYKIEPSAINLYNLIVSLVRNHKEKDIALYKNKFLPRSGLLRMRIA